MAVLTRREVDDGVRTTLRFPLKVELFPFQSWFKRFKEGNNPPPPHTHREPVENQLNLKLMNKSFLFVREREERGVNNFRATLVYESY